MTVSPESSGEDDFITIARVTKTQGRKGEVAATLFTDFPERFSTRKKLFALRGTKSDERRAAGGISQRRELELDAYWFHKGMVVLKFAGVDSISEAETLIGCEIQVPFSERAELGTDEFYVSDLAGCTVTDSGHEIGQIRDVQFGSGEAPLLIVQGKKEQLIPFAAAYIEKVDLEQRRVNMKLPEGMLELDAPLYQREKQRQLKKSG
ncbi:MAG: ribosome maturation factor RimM [Candidatus Angelobacter sp.]